MIKMLSSGHTVVICDGDTPETVAKKLSSAQYVIDMRTDITVPLEVVAREYDPNFNMPAVKKPKYKFNT